MPEIKYKMPRKLRDAWIADLISGNYAQGEGALYTKDNENDEYCCLGVLVCTAQKLGYPVALAPRDEPYSDALVWEGETKSTGDYDPLKDYLFIDGTKQGTGGFFAPFVRRNDGFSGNETRGERSVPKLNFTQIAEFLRENVEAVD